VITSSLTITGRGAETTIIERDPSAPAFRFFVVDTPGTLSLEKLTLRGGGGHNVLTGSGGGSFSFGGAIVNGGTLTVTRSTLTGNAADGGGGSCGGAIVNSGTLTVARSTFTDNVAAFGGGGICNSGGTVTITNSTLAHNDGGHDSGAVGNGGTMVITATTFAHNAADGAGAIFNTGTLTVTNSTFTDN
jgi:hypothetical protein